MTPDQMGLLALLAVSGTLIGLFTQKHCPGHVRGARRTVFNQTSARATVPCALQEVFSVNLATTSTSWNYARAHHHFDPQGKHLELWVELDGHHNGSVNHPHPMYDGYIEVYAFDKRCAFGTCAPIAKYDLDLGVNQICKECPRKIYTGDTPFDQQMIRTHQVGDLIPRHTRLHTCNEHVTSSAVRKSTLYLTDLPSSTARYHNCSLYLYVAAREESSIRFFLTEKRGIF